MSSYTFKKYIVRGLPEKAFTPQYLKKSFIFENLIHLKLNTLKYLEYEFIIIIIIIIIITYHDFLPPPRRGSHVKSDCTHILA